MSYLLLGPEENRNSVELWSITRPPFEPKGWMLKMRQSLRAALAAMRQNGEGTLRAVYTSTLPDLCDIENVLLYNVGTSAFGPLCQKGLFLERRMTPVPQPPGYDPQAPYAHHLLYTTEAKKAGEAASRKRQCLAIWNTGLCPPITSSIKPHSIWYLMKQSAVTVFPARRPAGTPRYYGMSIEIGLPEGARVAVAGIIKPVLDGIISAFHSQEGRTASAVLQWLSHKLQLEESEVQRLLTDPHIAVLGPRCLVHPFREGVQWNPADDRFMQVGVIVNRDATTAGWTMRGEVYELVGE